ncbi:hypothetical protein HELRODRAFT_172977 [Helobdella robusta]|uniref:Uncharacterized protein n=1 Tax=Helobdella robusta TaxID=6412 RepID=T1F685_HELRO|nr:hypothetical protein HELRODRAFT_172977 [Helobdella robusta]ESO03942.1 hypothetical protein HELRODRAFT_172977 [Helobdella robusta]
MADELCNDEALTSVENMYQVTMLEIINRVITELNDRFESLNNVNSMFGFLSGVKIEEMQTADLKIKAENLANIYSADLNIDEFIKLYYQIFDSKWSQSMFLALPRKNCDPNLATSLDPTLPAVGLALPTTQSNACT